jgi:ankyrin repeat protein
MELPDILAVLSQGTILDLEELTRRIPGFPDGCDDWGDPWIIDAVTYGSRATVQWMISRGVDLTVRDTISCTVLHTALERDEPDKYEILELLLQHGAPVNVRGWMGFEKTPAHLAVMNDDVEALRILVKYGADMSLKDGDFDGPPETPLEYARSEQKVGVVEFLEQLTRDSET